MRGQIWLGFLKLIGDIVAWIWFIAALITQLTDIDIQFNGYSGSVDVDINWSAIVVPILIIIGIVIWNFIDWVIALTKLGQYQDDFVFVNGKWANDPGISVKNKSSQSLADELAKFKILYDDGAITQEEYNRKKSQLLGS